jgi:hypothetical protein
MAAIWSFSRQTPLALLPFAVYSVFHVATYIRSNVLPTFQPTTVTPQPGARPKATGPVADGIQRFIKEYYDSSMTLVAMLELALWVRLLGSAVLFQRGSWLLLLAYSVFLRARFAQSSFVQGAVANLSARGDATFANKSADPRARMVWEQVKDVLRHVHNATDLNQYVGAKNAAAAQAGKKEL